MPLELLLCNLNVCTLMVLLQHYLFVYNAVMKLSYFQQRVVNRFQYNSLNKNIIVHLKNSIFKASNLLQDWVVG